jgi:hypothetical protein
MVVWLWQVLIAQQAWWAWVPTMPV